MAAFVYAILRMRRVRMRADFGANLTNQISPRTSVLLAPHEFTI